MMTKLESTKAEATKAAKALKAKMKTKGWKIHVWENIEWHFCISNAQCMISVHESGEELKKYSCLLSDGKVPYCGSYSWPDNKLYSDPNEAVEASIELAFDYVHKLEAHLKSVMTALYG